MLLLGICAFFAATVALGEGATTTVLPLKYNPKEEQVFDKAWGQSVLKAHINCNSLDDAAITVCAELPYNWIWKPDHGFVFLNIFNNLNDTQDLNKTIASTGKPKRGAPLPSQCVQIPKWPGGNLFIRVDSNEYYPVRYVVSALVVPATKLVPKAERLLERSGQLQIKPVDVINTIPMMGTAVMGSTMELVYDTEVLLEMDVCYDTTITVPTLHASIIAPQGLVSLYVCKDVPCTVDSPNVVCSVPTAMPVETCKAYLHPNQEKAYAYIHAAGGKKVPPSNQYITKFRFAASIEP